MRKIVFDIETRNTIEEVGKIDPLLMDIAVVCIHDSETNEYKSFFENELSQLWPILEHTDVLIGYNSDHFDVPLLNKYYPGDLTSIKSIDLLKEIKKSLGKRLKLDSVAQATLGRGKIGNGLEAITWWQNGEYERVKEYCLEDVRVTKEIYEYALEHKKLLYTDYMSGDAQEVEIDTSDWEEKEDTSMTHTLPF